MKKATTSERLKELMDERGLRQIDILEKAKPFCEKHNVKLNKSDLSQYVSGSVEPGQEKLAVLGMALDVSEAWLMGFDVEKERNNQIGRVSSYYSKLYKTITVDNIESKIITNYRNADNIDKAIVLRTLHIEDEPKTEEKNRYEPTEEDIKSLVARNGKKLTREQAIDLISTLFSEDDEDEE